MALRSDLRVIAEHVKPGSRVLDIGCGDGDLMAVLSQEKQADARGIEIDPESVEHCVSRGLSAIQGDADHDLAEYPDDAFDYAILSQTLQTAERPDLMLDELLRVGREAFVSFPNFAHWQVRADLLFTGRMPVTNRLPVTWYETQNIHHLTVADFEDLLREKGVSTVNRWFFHREREIGHFAANWRAEYAVYQLSR
ncbi:methionine biosynthesis protein MetW [Altericroceibacterium spongiae]|uniref:Methionine biosynthesis protein MetW n=1 Tax=Altericroceibacterium spongiae TaxID=2320269 RepID=A0A420EPT3_9SPHN|nr:methionine biosynthesis protein MetW [Altericroceibacterium spongiae]RKF22688.1 methionine biosynthesis protein MetW [Altericroceibacterium spongiae]